MTVYLRPIALADSPQSEEGEAIRLAGGMVYASRFALIRREGGPAGQVERFQKIDDAAQHLLAIVNDILDLA